METIATMTGLGHQQAFSALLQQHAGIVFKVANTYARGSDDRADLAQEIAVQLWRAWPKYDPSRSVTVDIFDDDIDSSALPPTAAPARLATRLVPTTGAQLGRFKMIWSAKEDARVVRRAVRVTLTPAGKELQQTVGRSHARSVERGLRALTPDEQRKLKRLVTKLLAPAELSNAHEE